MQQSPETSECLGGGHRLERANNGGAVAPAKGGGDAAASVLPGKNVPKHTVDSELAGSDWASPVHRLASHLRQRGGDR